MVVTRKAGWSGGCDEGQLCPPGEHEAGHTLLSTCINRGCFMSNYYGGDPDDWVRLRRPGTRGMLNKDHLSVYYVRLPCED